MKRYSKPTTELPVESEVDSEHPEFDVEKLLSHGGEILRREIGNLMRESTRGKLNPANARDLVAYVKLLSELKVEEQKTVKDLTDEELEKIAKANSPLRK